MHYCVNIELQHVCLILKFILHNGEMLCWRVKVNSNASSSAIMYIFFIYLCCSICTINKSARIFLTAQIFLVQTYLLGTSAMAAHTRQMMLDLYISQILLQLFCNVIVWERICDGGKLFCKP